jgi:hypothetical protein
MSQQDLLFIIALAVMWSLCFIPPATISGARGNRVRGGCRGRPGEWHGTGLY